MTRTERQVYPRAIEKDHHLSKNGLSNNIRKDGAGAHGWGSLDEELNHFALGNQDGLNATNNRKISDASSTRRRLSNVSVEERDHARRQRQSFKLNGNSDNINLLDLARTSASAAQTAVDE